MTGMLMRPRCHLVSPVRFSSVSIDPNPHTPRTSSQCPPTAVLHGCTLPAPQCVCQHQSGLWPRFHLPEPHRSITQPGWFNSQNSGFEWLVLLETPSLFSPPAGPSLFSSIAFLFLLLRFIFWLCVWLFCQYVCRCPVCMADTSRAQKQALDSMGLIGCKQSCECWTWALLQKSS